MLVMRRVISAIALGAASCADPTPLAAPAPTPTYYSGWPGGKDLPPGRRPPPTIPFSSRTALIASRVDEAVERYHMERWEAFIDAVDPGELVGDLRVSQSQIQQGQWKLEWLFANGDELFEHDFAGDGFGPGFSRVHKGSTGGPDALSCAECHHRGGFDGAGDRSQNAFFDGDGKDPSSAFERNAPHTLGLGAIEKLAEEMTRELQQKKNVAVATATIEKKPWRVALSAKGVSFGTLTARPDGTLDTTGVLGIDDDLVVKPFGWKGAVRTIREFAIDGFQRHHGLQLSGTDADKDGMPAEITEGMITSISVYLALLEVPVVIPPSDPELSRRYAAGASLFGSVGCATCHVPTLLLEDTKLRFGPLEADLLADAEEPRLALDAFGRFAAVPVNLFSDLKRHAMGPALSEDRPTIQGIAADEFLTRPLWGLASTGPWLHDGRAETIDETILLHGGEAQKTRDRFALLPEDEKASLRIYLLSLSRYPRLEYR